MPALQQLLQLEFLRRVRLRVQFTVYFYRHRFDVEDEEEDRRENVPFRSAMLSLTEYSLAERIDVFLAKIIQVI